MNDKLKPSKDEVQIEALDACPVIDGKLVGVGASWYTVNVTKGKVTIGYIDCETGKEKTEEFDIRGVKLSGFPVATSTANSLQRGTTLGS